MSEQKERLRRLLNSLPMDDIERKATEEGIINLNDEKAEEIVKILEKALAPLPEALAKLEKALAEYESQKQKDQ